MIATVITSGGDALYDCQRRQWIPTSTRTRILSHHRKHLSLTMLAIVSSVGRAFTIHRRQRAFALGSWTVYAKRPRFDSQYASLDDEPHDRSGYQRPVVQWYPGHIAKAERQLQQVLKAVDVVLEVRDARLPVASAHPNVLNWCGGKPRLVVLTHVDAVPRAAQKAWQQHYTLQGLEAPDVVLNAQVQNQRHQAAAERSKYNNVGSKPSASIMAGHWVNAKSGQGVHALVRAIQHAGQHVQIRRQTRNLQPRPLRIGVMGFPNVGKSALINQLVGGRKRARTANTPGVTRALQWIRINTSGTAADGSAKKSGKLDLELLDAPGVIPATLVNQADATLLAACNCIGEAAYDNQKVAAFLCDWMLHMWRDEEAMTARILAPQWRDACRLRYQLDPLSDKLFDNGTKAGRPRTGEDILFDIADATCQGNPEDASRKILQDFRAGRWGPVCLQHPPVIGDVATVLWSQNEHKDGTVKADGNTDRPSTSARRRARELRIELPPAISDGENDDATTTVSGSDVGRGAFDGW